MIVGIRPGNHFLASLHIKDSEVLQALQQISIRSPSSTRSFVRQLPQIKQPSQLFAQVQALFPDRRGATPFPT